MKLILLNNYEACLWNRLEKDFNSGHINLSAMSELHKISVFKSGILKKEVQ